MEGVPTPLRIGSPAVGRNPSDEQVPSPLRVGSPLVERGTQFSRPPLSSRSTSDRLSQLFPSRPASVVPINTDHDSSRRTSYPSPLTPAAEQSYRIPRAPAPPTLYDKPTSDLFDTHHPPPEVKPGGTHRLLNRLTSLRNARTNKQYGVLEDQDDADRSRGLKGVDEEDEALGYDISGLSGSPIAMKSMDGKKMKSTADSIDAEQELLQAGFAAEYDRLEAQPRSGNRALGLGMGSVVEAPFVHHPGPVHQHRRGPSNVDSSSREEAQKAAEKAGEILAVAEAPLMDISNLGGAEYETRSVLNASMENGNGPTETSYYFPPDPDMPSWRPTSMHWPYISLLIVIALALAGLQEFLCQLSIQRSKAGGGLLQFKSPKELSITSYFTWKYAPVLTLVTYGILWQISDFEVKRLEPYYQLSKKTGATAGESINMDYLTFMSWLVPFRALKYRQYAVIYSSLATLVSGSLVPVLQSASINMYPPKKDRQVDELKYVRIIPMWSRLVTASLCCVAICGVVLLFQLRRKSGLQSDPKGIAGVAAMATRSHILTDFHGLDTVPLHLIHKQLRRRRYILHKSSLWQGEYIRNSKESVREHGSDPRPLMLRRRAGIPYICFLILFFAAIPVFMFVDGANAVTEKIPFLLTAIATGVKLLWGTLDCDVRMLEPFYILSRGRAPPRTLTLDYSGTMPGWLPIKSLMSRHYIVSMVGFGAILTEVLTVCVSSFSVDGKKFFPGQGHSVENVVGDLESGADDRFNSDETFKSFWVSFALVQGILMTLFIFACIIYLRRSHKFIPRQIGTIASVLAFIHQSKMLVSFVDTEKMDSKQMTDYLESLPKTYALGWFSGRDGEDHCGIDEEPILAPYKYGVDWTKTRVLGSQIGTWENY